MIAYLIDFYERIKPRKLLDSVIAIVMLLVIALMMANGGIFSRMMFEIVENQTENRALQAAKHVALMPELQRFINDETKLNTVHSLAENIRRETETHFISITNARGEILTHPNITLIGQKTDDPLAVRALQHGRAYVLKFPDTINGHIRGVAPIINRHYDIIGMVSVGFPIRNIQKVANTYLEKGIFFIFVFITLGLIAAILIAQGVKRAIFGLEPSEIAYMFQERSAMIESIREGIIAGDHCGKITLVNEAALKTLNITDKKALNGMLLSAVFPFIDMVALQQAGERIYDKECVIKGVPLIVNVEQVGKVDGFVVTFRKRQEIDIIARELSQVQTYSEMLRAQTHEYSNSLHTIVGMIQIEAYDEVLDYIAEETKGHRNLIRFLTENVPDRILSSLIIGKYMHAVEQKVEFNIDPESQMIDMPDSLDRFMLTTALGNLLENAIEASLTTEAPHVVNLSMSDFGHDLIFEVEDSGTGIQGIISDKIFDRGISTKKGSHRGLGLYLAKKSIETIGGAIYFDQLDRGGCRFEVIIPKGETS